ncbi:MAG: GNAT family N-acetyltransferase [Myxococcales bacterium]|nr:GNAT family N-acetyltransferase [Myxococcales bacterium]
MRIEISPYSMRSYREGDAASLAQHANNPRIAANLRDAFPNPYTLEDAERWLGIAKTMDPITVLAITNETDLVIGGIGLVLGQDVHRFCAELGYWLSESYWGQGIMPRAVQAFTAWGFETFQLKRIFAEPYAHNPASCRVLEKSGFQREGTMRANVFKNQRFVDQHLYALIAP